MSGSDTPPGSAQGPAPLEVKRLDAAIALLAPAGGLDGEDLERELRRSIDTLVADGVTGLVIDMRAFSALDSSGLGALVACHGDVADHRGVRLVLTGVGPLLRNTLSRAMLLQVLPVFDTVERALAALRA